MEGWPSFSRWVRATWLGWFLGVPLIIALALVGEAVGIGGSQSLVGLGMGVGVGLLQARALRAVLQGSAAWFWTTALGLGLPFLAWDIIHAWGVGFAYSLQLCVTLGGLICGSLQALVLPQPLLRRGAWVLGSVAGWTLAALPVEFFYSLVRSQAIRGAPGALLFLGFVANGGLILGVISGGALLLLRRSQER